jgi:hypothetical protein
MGDGPIDSICPECLLIGLPAAPAIWSRFAYGAVSEGLVKNFATGGAVAVGIDLTLTSVMNGDLSASRTALIGLSGGLAGAVAKGMYLYPDFGAYPSLGLRFLSQANQSLTGQAFRLILTQPSD